MHLVALVEQQLSKIGAVLAGHASDQGDFMFAHGALSSHDECIHPRRGPRRATHVDKADAATRLSSKPRGHATAIAVNRPSRPPILTPRLRSSPLVDRDDALSLDRQLDRTAEQFEQKLHAAGAVEPLQDAERSGERPGLQADAIADSELIGPKDQPAGAVGRLDQKLSTTPGATAIGRSASAIRR